MPELHISGRFPYHNSSLDNNAIGASYDAISILMVTGRSFNSTNPTSVPTNTIDSESSLCGIVSFIIFFFCFALVTLIAFGIWLSRKRRIVKTRKSQDSNESFKMEPLSFPNSVHTKWFLFWILIFLLFLYFILCYHSKQHDRFMWISVHSLGNSLWQICFSFKLICS